MNPQDAREVRFAKAAAKQFRGVGELRIMFDLFNNERVLLVLGIVNRRDLERWLRNR